MVKDHLGQFLCRLTILESFEELLEPCYDAGEWLVDYMTRRARQLQDAAKLFRFSQFKLQASSQSDVPGKVDDPAHLAFGIFQGIGGDFEIEGLSVPTLMNVLYMRGIACCYAIFQGTRTIAVHVMAGLVKVMRDLVTRLAHNLVSTQTIGMEKGLVDIEDLVGFRIQQHEGVGDSIDDRLFFQ